MQNIKINFKAKPEEIEAKGWKSAITSISNQNVDFYIKNIKIDFKAKLEKIEAKGWKSVITSISH